MVSHTAVRPIRHILGLLRSLILYCIQAVCVIVIVAMPMVAVITVVWAVVMYAV